MTTGLEILNHLLGVIGESPVSNFDSNHPAAVTARNTVNRVNKEMQTRGWWFNKEYNLNLLADINNQIILPSGTLQVAPRAPYSYLVRRNGKLYDPIKHTYSIAANIRVDVTLLLAIEDLPETAAIYLMHKAAYEFYTDDDGEEKKSSALGNRVMMSWSSLNQEELNRSRVNSRNTPTSARLRFGIGYINGNPMYPGGRP